MNHTHMVGDFGGATILSQENAEIGVYRPQYDQIAERITAYIREHNLTLGDRLPTEQEFGTLFGVSRTIVRDAIKMLTPSGLVRPWRGRGIFVGEPTTAMPSTVGIFVPPEQVSDLFDFRSAQEMLVARLAAQSITVLELRALEHILVSNQHAADVDDWEAFLQTDVAFHGAIATATHNEYFVETIVHIMHLQRWVVKILTGGAPGSLQNSAEQHTALFQAIRDGDGDRAAEAARMHVASIFAAYQREAYRRIMHEA